MKKLIIILLTFVFISCNDDNEKIILNVSDIKLTDVGQVHYEFNFEATYLNDNIQKCYVRTNLIKKNDTIKYIEALVQGNNLNINIVSSPYDFDCNSEECLSIHDVEFNLIGLEKGNYVIDVGVNHGHDKKFNYTFYN